VLCVIELRSMTISKLDRIHGMLVGVALGDALGHPHEFRYNNNLYTGKLQYRAEHRSQWQETKYAVVGQYTDDTEMTFALAQSLIRKKEYNQDDVILSYQHWANTTGTGMDVNIRSLFKGVETVRGFWGRHARGIEGILSGARSRLIDTKSNGSLMRCSPLSLLKGYDGIIQDVDLTNPTTVNQDCTALYVKALRLLQKGNDPFKVYEKIKDLASDPDVKQVFQTIDTGTKRDILEMKGYVVHSFYCAMLSLVMIGRSLRTFAKVIDYIIRLGGDTDTNAAIVGALIGSYMGFDKMMTEKITKENYDIMISMDPSKGGCPIDERYMPTRIKDIAEELVSIFG
jgi:ADP-ribosyl-[dinitrogen reductase] hydrolase